MIVHSAASAVVGAVLGLHFKVLILVPTMSLECALLVAAGIARGQNLWQLGLGIAVVTTSTQLGYVLGTTVRYLFDVARDRLDSAGQQRQTARGAAWR